MEMFILIYIFAGAVTTMLLGMSCRHNDPTVEAVAICFFLWWLVLSIQIGFWCAALGKLIRNKCITSKRFPPTNLP